MNLNFPSHSVYTASTNCINSLESTIVSWLPVFQHASFPTLPHINEQPTPSRSELDSTVINEPTSPSTTPYVSLYNRSKPSPSYHLHSTPRPSLSPPSESATSLIALLILYDCILSHRLPLSSRFPFHGHSCQVWHLQTQLPFHPYRIVFSNKLVYPLNLQHSMKLFNSPQWQQAMNEEYSAI